MMSEVRKGLHYFVLSVLLQGNNSYKLSSNMGRAIFPNTSAEICR